MVSSFLLSTATTADTSDQVAIARVPTPGVPERSEVRVQTDPTELPERSEARVKTDPIELPERSEAKVKTDPTELPASPVAITQSNAPRELPASPPASSTTNFADAMEDLEATKVPAMSNEKKDRISDEKHGGSSLQEIKHDPRAGSGIEFVSPLEEEEKQLHQASPQNEVSNPKYSTLQPESEGLQALPGQNQGNTAVYINHEEEEGVDGRPEDDWHYTLCSCWSQKGLCMSSKSTSNETIY
ncbi:hypothetical protein E2P81_ATG10770 [Venturia nashicola]|nr:hypothetical protein E2P81_ATG10770 [Venturia nashicola]